MAQSYISLTISHASCLHNSFLKAAYKHCKNVWPHPEEEKYVKNTCYETFSGKTALPIPSFKSHYTAATRFSLDSF